MKRITAVIAAIDIALSAGTFGAKTAQKQMRNMQCEQTYAISQYSDTVKNLGAFSLTFYTPYEDEWGYQTSTGATSQHLRTCAVDPSVIPYGTVLKIYGNNGKVLYLKAVDCGGGIKGNRIDIFWDGSQASGYDFMAEFGTIHNVYIVEE